MILRQTAYYLIALLAVCLSGCGLIHDNLPPCAEENRDGDAENVLALKFRVHTTAETLSRSASRADNQGHPEQGSDNAAREDFIDLTDFAIFFFAGQGDEAKLIYSNADIGHLSGDLDVVGSYGDYTVSMMFRHKLIEALIGDGKALSPSGTRTMTLTVAMLANIAASLDQSPDYSQFTALQVATDEDIDGAATFGQFCTLANALTYHAPVNATDVTSMIIPLYGLASFTITEPQMFMSRPDQRIELGDVSMLRAMTKVRLVDNIAGKDANGYPKIISARLLDHIGNGYVTPENPGTYVNGTQVHADRVHPQILDYDGNGNPHPNHDLPMRVGTVVPNSFVVCPPVQPITAGLAPVITVNVQRNATTPAEQFTIDLADPTYTTITESWGSTLLRNHVYTLSVEDVKFGANLTLTATVADWDDAPEFTFQYSNGVTRTNGGSIIWRDVEPGQIVNNTQLLMLPWHDGKSVPAKCTFGFNTPVGATWTASLLFQSGEPGAFKFLTKDADGNDIEVDEVNGRVSGTLETLQIVTTIENPTVNSSVRLRIVVLTEGGNSFTLATDGSILEQWTLIQNMQ